MSDFSQYGYSDALLPVERRMQHSKNTRSLHWTVWKHNQSS